VDPGETLSTGIDSWIHSVRVTGDVAYTALYLEIYFDRCTILTLFYLALDCEACHDVEPGLLGRCNLRQATSRGERGTQSTRMTRRIHAMVVVGDERVSAACVGTA